MRVDRCSDWNATVSPVSVTTKLRIMCRKCAATYRCRLFWATRSAPAGRAGATTPDRHSRRPSRPCRCRRRPATRSASPPSRSRSDDFETSRTRPEYWLRTTPATRTTPPALSRSPSLCRGFSTRRYRCFTTLLFCCCCCCWGLRCCLLRACCVRAAECDAAITRVRVLFNSHNSRRV